MMLCCLRHNLFTRLQIFYLAHVYNLSLFLALTIMPPQHAWFIDESTIPFVSTSERTLSTANKSATNNTTNSSSASSSFNNTNLFLQCSNDTKTNRTCGVHGTCKGLFDSKQNITNYQCVCQVGFLGTFCNSTTNSTSTNGTITTSSRPTKPSHHIALIIFLLLLLTILFIFCASVARVVIKRRVERRRIVSATEELDLEDEIYVV